MAMTLEQISIPLDMSKALLEGSALGLSPLQIGSAGKAQTGLRLRVLIFFRSQPKVDWSIPDFQSIAQKIRQRGVLPEWWFSGSRKESLHQQPDRPVHKD
jgi:hypothetical protein